MVPHEDKCLRTVEYKEFMVANISQIAKYDCSCFWICLGTHFEAGIIRIKAVRVTLYDPVCVCVYMHISRNHF